MHQMCIKQVVNYDDDKYNNMSIEIPINHGFQILFME
jgi:hypothetical protein